MSARDELQQLNTTVQQKFLAEKHVLSFEEFLEEFIEQPARHSRDAARYLRDCFDHFGTYSVNRAHGAVQRFRLFDQAFVGGDGHGSSPQGDRFRLVGQEALQGAFYDALGNFAREGRPNRLLLLHGPNGSAKSTFAACLMRALEHYSALDEGALYRFTWVFPTNNEEKVIGFGSRGRRPMTHDSFAHVDPARIAAKLGGALPEHPLLLLPVAERRALIERAYGKHGVQVAPPSLIAQGELAHNNAEVRDALLRAYGGDMSRVLAHVQVERYTISSRYRRGAVTIGPQMTVDASERQITADRTLAQLPAALSALSLFEPHGELVNGAGGLIEYSDLLKRPLDAWKYLLLAIESGHVALGFSLLPVNSVLLGSTNEAHLAAFRQHPEYESFRARLTLMRTGYLLDFNDERSIYDAQILPQVQIPVAPHTTFVAALWAVLTRLRRSDAKHYDDAGLGKLAASLTPLEKAYLYAEGTVPRRFSGEDAKTLRAGLTVVVDEFEHVAPYEGMFGVSPREVRTVLLDAAAHADVTGCLSPLDVLDRIEALCESDDYDFLQIDAEDGFHDPKAFVGKVRDVWVETVDDEVRTATNLVDDSQYDELFAQYVAEVSLWVKGEQVANAVTGKLQGPDDTLFTRVEDALGIEDADEFRRNLINRVAAHAIDHPGQDVRAAQVFPEYVQGIKDAYYLEHRGQIATRVRDMLRLIDEGAAGLEAQALGHAEQLRKALATQFGYSDPCARAALAMLLRERYLDD